MCVCDCVRVGVCVCVWVYTVFECVIGPFLQARTSHDYLRLHGTEL